MSRHNLSSYRLLTGDIGQLLPCGLTEVLPGDRFRHNASAMIRLSPMAAPVMHKMNIRLHHFFVPHRLSWDQEQAGGTFEDFITGGPDGTDATEVPTITSSGLGNDVFDYLGIPSEGEVAVSSLPIRAYNLIYNEWYRDQDLVPLADLLNTTIQNIAWQKDYFSTARPWAQKGEEVSLPLGTSAPVVADGNMQWAGSIEDVGRQVSVSATDDSLSLVNFAGGTNEPVVHKAGLVADLSAATAATINALRRASGLQRFAEARARYGSRYAEYVRHAFGAAPLDSRLQRPEFLGGGSASVSVSEVLQTAPDADERAFGVGDMYGHGIGMSRSNRYTVKFREHGYVISLLSVRPNAMYSNGVERTWLRQFREDFYQKELAHIGQQQVLEQEVYADSSNKGAVFGWSDRYAEYRETRSLATAEFRTVLDYWHLARQFSSPPALNQTFNDVDPADTKRIFNEQTAHSLWCIVNHSLQAQRVVPRNAQGRLL